MGAAPPTLDAASGANARALVLPGAAVRASTTGAGRSTRSCPRSTDRPVAVRAVVPYADLRAVDLLLDGGRARQQERAGARAAAAAARLLGGRRGGHRRPTTTATLSGALGAGATARRRWRREPALVGPDADFGPRARCGGRRGRPRRRAGSRCRRCAAHDAAGRAGSCASSRARPATVVDGTAGGVAGLAAFGALTRGAPLRYAADLDAGRARAPRAPAASSSSPTPTAAACSSPSRLRANVGATLGAGRPDLRGRRDARTRSRTRAPTRRRSRSSTAARYVRAPFSPQLPQFPEHRPFAALDGDPRHRLARRPRAARRPPLPRRRLRAPARRPVRRPAALRRRARRGRRSRSNGPRFARRPGWNRLARRAARRRRAARADRATSDQPAACSGGAGGIARAAHPRRARCARPLRPPVLVRARAARRRPVARGADVPVPRTTADDPFRRGPRRSGPWPGRRSLRDRVRPRAAARAARSPRRRRARCAADAWVSRRRPTPDDALDRLAGTRGDLGATSSGRYQGLPRRARVERLRRRPRDGVDRRRGCPGRSPTLRWATPRPVTVDRAAPRPRRARAGARPPTRVRGRRRRRAPVSPRRRRGRRCRAPLRGAPLRLEILGASFPAAARARAAPARGRHRARCAACRARGSPCRAPATSAGGAATRRVRTAAGAVALRAARRRAGARRRAAAARRGLRPAGVAAGRAPDGARRATGRCASTTCGCAPASRAPVARAGPPRRRRPRRRATGRGRARRRARRRRTRPRGSSRRVLQPRLARECDGRSLGEPRPDARLRERLARPRRAAATCASPSRPTARCRGGYAISARGVPGARGCCWSRRARRRRTRRRRSRELPDDAAPARWAGRRALAAGAIARRRRWRVRLRPARGGRASGPLVALILWRGIAARRLALLGGRAAARRGADRSTSRPRRRPRRLQLATTPRTRSRAHWVAVAAALLLIARSPSRWRAAGGQYGPGPARWPRARATGCSEHDRSLDQEVAREPRQLRELARGVAQPLRRRAGRAPVLDERPVAPHVAPAAAKTTRRSSASVTPTDENASWTSIVPAGRDARAPADEVVARAARSGARRRRTAGRPAPGTLAERLLRAARARGARGSATPARSRFARNARRSSSPRRPASSTFCCGPRSRPRCGSIATTSTPSAAARASTIVERPRNEPISTIRPPGPSVAGGARQALGLRVGQPALDAVGKRGQRSWCGVAVRPARGERHAERAGRRATHCSASTTAANDDEVEVGPALSRNGSATATTPSTHRNARLAAARACTARVR